MFWPDLQAIFRESSVKYTSYASAYLLEFSQVIKLLLFLHFLKVEAYKSGRNMSENRVILKECCAASWY